MKEYPSILNLYVGYFFAATFFGYEFFSLEAPYDLIVRLSIGLFGWLYFLYLVYTVHEVIEVRYSKQYPISPTKAMFTHLIPIYQVYWVYKWPRSLQDYIRRREQKDFFDSKVVVALLLGGTALTRFDFAIGYALVTTAMLILLKGIKELMLANDPDLMSPTIVNQQPHGA